MKKFLTVVVLICILWFLAKKAFAAPPLPQGFCESVRLKGTQHEETYNAYFDRVSSIYNNSESVKRWIVHQKVIIERLQGLYCS